mmetsp:Transcript_4728/g.13258  ORF Transcript_4728/g.13258 Transcript_4728/m.13258 type:complete len:459 (+) Transcript_4728:1054-2430(+)
MPTPSSFRLTLVAASVEVTLPKPFTCSRCIGMLNLNTLPFPISLSSHILPPERSTMTLLMDSPNPVPLVSLVSVPSTCSKGRKTFSTSCAGIPRPVSSTSKCSMVSWPTSVAWLLVPPSDTRMQMEPQSVNLTALVHRLMSTCRSRTMSPPHISGMSGCRWYPRLSLFLSAMMLTVSITSSMHCLMLTGSASFCPSFTAAAGAASTLEKSNTWFSSAIICWALQRTMDTSSCCSLVSCSSDSSIEQALMAFMGVRSSWLMLARNCALERAEFSAISRALAISSSVFFCDVRSCRCTSHSESLALAPPPLPPPPPTSSCETHCRDMLAQISPPPWHGMYPSTVASVVPASLARSPSAAMAWGFCELKKDRNGEPRVWSRGHPVTAAQPGLATMMARLGSEVRTMHSASLRLLNCSFCRSTAMSWSTLLAHVPEVDISWLSPLPFLEGNALRPAGSRDCR